MTPRLLARKTIEERLVQLIEEKHKSLAILPTRVLHVMPRLMATNTSGNFETDTQRILDEES